MEDDVIGTAASLVKGSAAQCDLCGRPMSDAHLYVATIDRGDGGSAEAVRICEHCRSSLASEDVPFDAEVEAGLRDLDE